MSDVDKSKGLPVVDVSSNHKEVIVTEKTVLADRRTKTFHFDKVFGQNSKQVIPTYLFLYFFLFSYLNVNTFWIRLMFIIVLFIH